MRVLDFEKRVTARWQQNSLSLTLTDSFLKAGISCVCVMYILLRLYTRPESTKISMYDMCKSRYG